MSAMTKGRRLVEEKWSYKQFTLASGKKAWKNGIAVYDESAAACIPGEVQTDLFMLGLFAEDVDATAGAKLVNVKLKKEVTVRWFVNDGTNPVAATNIGQTVYAIDDQTVSSLSTGRSAIGIAWALDTTLGVAVEMV